MDINLGLTLDEVNAVLLGLAERPYKDVHELIPKIQHMAKAQVGARDTPPATTEQSI